MKTLGPVTLIGVTALVVVILFCRMSTTVLLAEPPSATRQPKKTSPSCLSATAYADAKLTFKIIAASHHTYGYDVFADGRLMIHQPSVPALPGNEGFKTRDDATKVALLVIEKIRQVEMPPSISIEEMRTLKVIQ